MFLMTTITITQTSDRIEAEGPRNTPVTEFQSALANHLGVEVPELRGPYVYSQVGHKATWSCLAVPAN